MAIADPDLRNQRKDHLLDRVETKGEPQNMRKNVRPHKRREPLVARTEFEHSVSRPQQTLSIWQTFFVVGIKQLLASSRFTGQGKFPGKVVTVLYPSVHSLTAGRSVNVCGIARDKASAFRESIYCSGMYLVNGKPIHMADIQSQLRVRLDLAFDLFE